MGHESYVRHDEVKGSSNRAFGVVFAVVFTTVALLPLLFSHDPHWWALPIAGTFGMLAWLAWRYRGRFAAWAGDFNPPA